MTNTAGTGDDPRLPPLPSHHVVESTTGKTSGKASPPEPPGPPHRRTTSLILTVVALGGLALVLLLAVLMRDGGGGEPELSTATSVSVPTSIVSATSTEGAPLVTSPTTEPPASRTPTTATTMAAPPPSTAESADVLAATSVVDPADYAGADWGGSGELALQDSSVTFTSPSGNITCYWLDDANAALTCDILERDNSPTERDCGHISWIPTYVSLHRGAIEDGACTGGIMVPLGGAILPYGSALRYGGHGCISEEHGITCVHLASGRGFLLNRSALTRF